MPKLIHLCRAVAIAGCFAASGGAFAQSVTVAEGFFAIPRLNRTVQSTIKVKPTGGVLAPLTSGECTRLGGSVEVETACNGGKVCKTVDQNHETHRVCISSQ